MKWLLSTAVLASIVGWGTICLAQGEPATDPDQPGKLTVQSKDPYNVYASGLFQEVFIDEDFKIYKVRNYQGVVPGREDEGFVPDEPMAEAPKGKTRIERIGFEQRELFSRIFVVADRVISPWVYDNFVQAQADPSIPFQVYVELSQAKIPKTNDQRPLVTRNFNTPVMSIHGEETEETVRVVINLKREARYLPVQIGKILYIDVER
jgi:hypothetical protein